MSQQPQIDFDAMSGASMMPLLPGMAYDDMPDMPEIPYSRSQAESLPAIPSMAIARRRLEPFRSAAVDIEEKALAVKVMDDTSQTQAVALAGEVKKTLKAVEEARKGYVSPFNDHVKGVNALAAEIRTPLERAEHVLKKQLGAYEAHKELERRKAEEEARRQAAEEQARLNAEAASAGVEAPLVPEIVTPAASSAVRTANGTAYTRSQWTFDLINLAEVPAEYLMLDEKKVRAAIKQGVRTISGLNIHEVKNISIRG